MSNPEKLLELIKLKKNLSKPKFKIKGVSFDIVKLPPMAGFDLSEFIRTSLARSADSFSIDDKTSEDENAVLFFKAVLGLNPDVVKHIRGELFQHIQFSGNGVEKGWADLAGMEDTAFQGFEIIHIYEVMGRALFINFLGSFSAIVSAFPGAESYLKSLIAKT